ncbi:formyltransferase [Chromobacterium violaceum]|uniref:Formyltransferase n=1 Tax=Chromobacterium violaceum TaxID=536 RepID=A0A202BG56_CHRVL|nr:formyltransferase [Chromobacterium violaceum]KMN50704.1 formyltransferase [Chromobacterium violaceum]KMN87200.1 formyltransferase [Chromobacterium violaceum]KMN89675.1 formyltransferase [Chromobacterium violaceum]KMO03718.1 formyltransferase [Chromobacterium violaceum]MBA8734095.1 formyltransferase [Chromobacterium violaceum]
MSRAVVFAYHNVGVRCLKALIGRGVDVALVVTHQDNPNENIWFHSVAQTARDYGIPVITPDDPNSPEVVAQVQACQADFLFSFYYRHMLKAPLLEAAKRGAYNMHGSLLPKYRGRVPINWAIIHGETETGATLHQMNVKPDNGPVVDQMAVPILPDDTADEVFAKVTVAAEMVLWRSLPGLIAGDAPHVQQDLSQGGYFGGRKPEDGRIDAQAPARRLHDFVRALARPFPGAYADTAAGRLLLWKTLPAGQAAPADRAELRSADGRLWLHCADGGRLAVLEAELDGQPLAADNFAARVGSDALAL